MKLRCYKKIAECHKRLKNYEKALYSYKKQMQLAWYEKDTAVELETYDNIGISYYYLGNIEKAVFYHNRFVNKQLEGDTLERQWNEYVLRKKASAQPKTNPVFEECKGASFAFPHENKHYASRYFLKQSLPADLNKVASPKYEKNDVRKQILLEALKHSFMEGNITHDAYNAGQKDETQLNSFTLFKRKSHLATNAKNPYSKLQKHTRALIMQKLRTLSLLKTNPSNKRNNSLTTIGGNKSFTSKRCNITIKQTSNGNLYLAYSIDMASTYSHLCSDRIKLKGKVHFAANQYLNTVKIISDIIEFALKLCAEYTEGLPSNTKNKQEIVAELNEVIKKATLVLL